MNFLQLLISTVILIDYFYIVSSVKHTLKASKNSVDRINALLNQKIEKLVIFFCNIYK